MSNWIAIGPFDSTFALVEEMASGLQSTVDDDPRAFYAWYNIESGATLLVAGEKKAPNHLDNRPAAGTVRIQIRYRDGISQTIGTPDGAPFWDAIEHDLQPTLRQRLEEARDRLIDRFDLPAPDEPLDL
jgi:hypothetical protein